MKKILMFTTALFISLSLVGCNFNKDKGGTEDGADNGTKGNMVEENNGDVVDEGNGTNDDLTNGNDTGLEVAEDAADRIVELDEVDSATVIVTENNAYAAVVLGNNGDTSDTTDTNTSDTTDTNTNDTTDTNTNDTADMDEDLSADLKDKISNKVKEANADIENVYVSLNPDFVERMTEYRTKINDGEPVEGLFEEFTESIQRVFPDNH